MKIYVTHCSAKKDESLRETGEQVTPDRLYTSTRTQAFIRRCRNRGVAWAIFSDQYGIWFPDEKHGWYEKNPGSVTEEEYAKLRQSFDSRLAAYDEVLFVRHRGRFPSLYR